MSEETSTNKIINQETSESKNDNPEIQDILNADFLNHSKLLRSFLRKKQKLQI